MSKWNSCIDGLPKKDGRYLVCRYLGHHYIDIVSFTLHPYKVDKYDFIQYKNKREIPVFFDYDSEYGYYEIDNVRYWMEIPELPEE